MSFPNRAQRGYNRLPFPRICTTNTLGNGGNANGGANNYTAETYSRFGLNITLSAAVNPVALKQRSTENICIFYQNAVSMQVQAISGAGAGVPITAGQFIWPGWWLTNVGTTLTTSLNTTGGTGISMTLAGQPKIGFFGSQVMTANTSISTGTHAITFTAIPVPGSGNPFSTPSTYANGASVIIDSGTNFEVVTISSVSTTSNTVTFTATYGLTHASGCYIALLPFAALISNNANVANDEVVLVTNQTGAYTYTIQRGTSGTPIWNTPYGGATNPPSHAIGDRVAALIVQRTYTTTFELNPTVYCPVCPITASSGPNQNGMKWVDYLASLVQGTIGSYTFTDPEGITRPAYDGVFLDSCNQFPNPALPWGDADRNNLADVVAGDGPSPGPLLYTTSGSALEGQAFGYGVFNGIQYALRSLRNFTTNFPYVIVTNGSNYPLLGDGLYWESMEMDFSSPKPPGVFLYRAQHQAGVHASGIYPYPAVVYNYDLNSTNNIAGTESNGSNVLNGKPVYQLARLYFSAVTTMTDGFFCLDYGTTQHGQCWMLDEYDGAAGSCLTAQMTPAATSITTYSNPGWVNGTTLRIPLDYTASSPLNVAEDEVMTVNGAITGTGPYTVPVSRGITYNGVVQTKCQAQVGARVQTLAQQVAGQGWLGQALGPGTNQLSALGANLLSNPGFETGTAGTGNPPFGATFAGSWSVSNTSTGVDGANIYAGYAMIDSVNPHSGSQCLRYVTTVPNYQAYYDLNVNQTVAGTFNANTPWTFSFWARGDHDQTLEIRMTDVTNSAQVAVVYLPISKSWAQYWMTGYIGGTNSTSLLVQLGFANAQGSIWIDDCALQSGDPNLFTRDFQNGYVICNATNAAKVVTLPSPILGPWTTYQKLAGSQVPSINDGSTHAPGTTITVPANDGIFLKKA